MDINKLLFGFATVATLLSAWSTIRSFVTANGPADTESRMKAILLRASLVIVFMIAVIFLWPGTSGETAVVHYQRAEQFFNEHNRPKAIEEAKTTVSLEPTHLKAHKLLGACYLIDQNAGAASSEYKTASDIDPEDTEAMLGLATALEANAQQASALTVYRSLLNSPKCTPTQRQQANSRLKTLDK